ncbi:divalent-cation tolerance protein CutA [uncultured Erythrobacter sp.]|uniref:divalent-cation tolerance protein CutA n=1 Tax=uncultured Erythrobacter sp. TaxID=263913 RepID=UPI002617A28D|nr:divalent-cation tolerance protein CutA [uncultured Erythrobacter sp.]
MTEQVPALVWCPFHDSEEAHKAASVLLAENYIACANIIPAMQSIYEWQGEVTSSAEIGVLFKTTALQIEGLIARLGECHPYDTPAITAWNCDAAHPATMQWLCGTVGNG